MSSIPIPQTSVLDAFQVELLSAHPAVHGGRRPTRTDAHLFERDELADVVLHRRRGRRAPRGADARARHRRRARPRRARASSSATRRCSRARATTSAAVADTDVARPPDRLARLAQDARRRPAAGRSWSCARWPARRRSTCRPRAAGWPSRSRATTPDPDVEEMVARSVAAQKRVRELGRGARRRAARRTWPTRSPRAAQELAKRDRRRDPHSATPTTRSSRSSSPRRASTGSSRASRPRRDRARRGEAGHRHRRAGRRGLRDRAGDQPGADDHQQDADRR